MKSIWYIPALLIATGAMATSCSGSSNEGHNDSFGPDTSQVDISKPDAQPNDDSSDDPFDPIDSDSVIPPINGNNNYSSADFNLPFGVNVPGSIFADLDSRVILVGDNDTPNPDDDFDIEVDSRVVTPGDNLSGEINNHTAFNGGELPSGNYTLEFRFDSLDGSNQTSITTQFRYDKDDPNALKITDYRINEGTNGLTLLMNAEYVNGGQNTSCEITNSTSELAQDIGCAVEEETVYFGSTQKTNYFGEATLTLNLTNNDTGETTDLIINWEHGNYVTFANFCGNVVALPNSAYDKLAQEIMTAQLTKDHTTGAAEGSFDASLEEINLIQKIWTNLTQTEIDRISHRNDPGKYESINETFNQECDSAKITAQYNF
ncbi:hypothetical protein HN587_06465 [Candidatus Woesearchaeota archaeon]|jgi:hypothetical protein|nr:hypothetical protein [Candidatus Woesearchaeota archaeon]